MIVLRNKYFNEPENVELINQKEVSSEKKNKKSLGEKVALGIGATGATIGAGSYAGRQWLSHSFCKGKPYYSVRNLIGKARERRNLLAYLDSLSKDEVREEVAKCNNNERIIKAAKLGRAGVLAGAGLAIGGLGTAAYLKSRKHKKQENKSTEE